MLSTLGNFRILVKPENFFQLLLLFAPVMYSRQNMKSKINKLLQDQRFRVKLYPIHGLYPNNSSPQPSRA